MRFDVMLFCALAGAANAGEVTAPAFETRPLPAHVYDGGWEHFVGGGVAAFVRLASSRTRRTRWP